MKRFDQIRVWSASFAVLMVAVFCVAPMGSVFCLPKTIVGEEMTCACKGCAHHSDLSPFQGVTPDKEYPSAESAKAQTQSSGDLCDDGFCVICQFSPVITNTDQALFSLSDFPTLPDIPTPIICSDHSKRLLRPPQG